MIAPESWPHIEAIGTLFTLLSGFTYIIYRQGQRDTKIDTMWVWFTNHGSHLTGYKPPLKKKRGAFWR